MIAFAPARLTQGMFLITVFSLMCPFYFIRFYLHIIKILKLVVGFVFSIMHIWVFFQIGCSYVADTIWTFAKMSLERASILMLLRQIFTMEAQKSLV
jgi:hypothetical protein